LKENTFEAFSKTFLYFLRQEHHHRFTELMSDLKEEERLGEVIGKI
jgi:hypothetical protein